MLNFTTSEENYIKAIFHLQQGRQPVSTNALASSLDTRPASVTDMMKKLRAKKLLHYRAYKGFRLNKQGMKAALAIIRRHRLWEFFLAKKLRFAWDEVHELAEQLEHVSGAKLIDKLDAYLGYPDHDPHGDPIPDKKGKLKSSPTLPLDKIRVNRPATVCQVADQSMPILDLLKHKKIRIGSRITVKRKFDFDHSLEVKMNARPSFNISEQLGKKILVRYGA
jgi:DtxR family transcriptional regulator, Mn-dependent transcriptional regulator